MKSASSVCIGGYTFRMKFFVWLVILGAIGAIGYLLWKWRERWAEHKRASEERLAMFIAQARPMTSTPAAAPAATVVDTSLPLQKLLFEAALKASEAGEAAISIQLYARLLERYPESAFGGQAQAAIEQQKRKLANP
jgi:hypothetical protein